MEHRNGNKPWREITLSYQEPSRFASATDGHLVANLLDDRKIKTAHRTRTDGSPLTDPVNDWKVEP